jgi:hypothetical protein
MHFDKEKAKDGSSRMFSKALLLVVVRVNIYVPVKRFKVPQS